MLGKLSHTLKTYLVFHASAGSFNFLNYDTVYEISFDCMSGIVQ